MKMNFGRRMSLIVTGTLYMAEALTREAFHNVAYFDGSFADAVAALEGH